VPDWLRLEGPTTDHRGLMWRFTVKTDNPGRLLANVAFECDSGVGTCSFDLTVREGQPALGDLALCGSPFDGASFESIRTLARTLGALPLRVHCLDNPADIGPLRPRTLLLHQGGLLRCSPEDLGAVERLAGAGTSVVVLADEFFRGTTSGANRFLAPFGLRMRQAGADEPGLSSEERSRRVLDWQERYDRAPFDSGPAEVCPHRLTSGVRRVHWFRPCPVECVGPSARPLVRSPAHEGEGFAAVSEEKGGVVALGMSLWPHFSSVGWPYDNDRLLANALVGGDADVLVGLCGE
jgi:hypothetical protein